MADAGLLKPLYNKGDEAALKLYRKENLGNFDEQTKKWNELSEYEKNKYVLRTKEKTTLIKKTNTNKSKKIKGGNLNNDYFINYLKYKRIYLNEKYLNNNY